MLVLAAAFLPACAPRGGWNTAQNAGGGNADGTIGAAALSPFAPEALRIYPLTHLELGEDKRGLIVCHIELKDHWGDTTKGIGQLQVRLYRQESGVTPGLETQETVWDQDLSNLDNNAALFDPTTRTYRIQLIGVPEWVRNAAAGEGGAGPTRVKLKAVFTTVSAEGREVTLRDEYTVER